jgi:hypothetical protein
MPHPFPGMNPWLEQPALWRNVHASLIIELRNLLAPLLEPRYFVDVETHTYLAIAPDMPLRNRFPDVTILDVGGIRRPSGALVEATLPIEIDLPLPEAYEEAYLAIRLLPEGEVVTVIELLSHTNKRPGKDRESYLEKREAFLSAEINFVEIDLLRAWPPMPYTERATPSAYRIFVHRMDHPRKAYLYPCTVRQPIPIFSLPLLPDDEEPRIDLGRLLHEVYDRARYRLIIDYTKPTEPPLNEADRVWAAELLANR